MRRAVLLTTLALASPALADEGPSFDCSGAQSEAEQMICGDAELAALDRRLSARFADALAAVKGFGAGSGEAEQALRANQRGWIGGRDDCWKAADARACLVDAYERREAELVARYMLMAPISTVTWMCDGNPANEVVSTFYDTPLASVRIERGDTVDVGIVAISGSGSRYEGSFGRELWIKGDDAQYREADPDGTQYSCTLVK